MRNILFVGNMRVAFIRQDADLLKENNLIDVADVFRFRPVPRNKTDVKTWLHVLLSAPVRVYRNNVIWVWFADYHAIPFLLWSRLFRKKFVVQVGGGEVVAFPTINYGMQLNPVRGWIVRQIIRYADIVITDSDSYKNRIAELIGNDTKIRVSPNYVPEQTFDREIPEKKDWVVTAYCTDQIPELKGLPVFRQLSKLRPYEFKEFKALRHDKLIEMLLQSKVYCQLSLTEGDGVTVKEAMACGCVPVVTSTDAIPGAILVSALWLGAILNNILVLISL